MPSSFSSHMYSTSVRAGQFVHTTLPVAQLFLVVSVVEREHGRGMANLEETFARFAADALGGRVGRDQFGMLGLELLQLFKKLVELKIADLRIVKHVVAVLVVADLLTQCVNFFLDSVVRRSHGPRIIVCLRLEGRGRIGCRPGGEHCVRKNLYHGDTGDTG